MKLVAEQGQFLLSEIWFNESCRGFDRNVICQTQHIFHCQLIKQPYCEEVSSKLKSRKPKTLHYLIASNTQLLSYYPITRKGTWKAAFENVPHIIP